MPQFYVPPELISGNTFSLDEEESHHLLKVHRSRPGDAIQLFDGAGRRFKATIDSIDRKVVSGKILEELPEVPPRYRLILHVAALPRPKYEEILEKGTELGVAAFQVFTSERTVVKPSDTDGRRDRSAAILMSASKQCGRARLPELLSASAFAEAVAACRGAGGFLAYEEDRGAALTGLPQVGHDVHVFIGPEGGFTRREVEQAKAAGIRTFGLGDTVLRAETAALAAAALVLIAR